MDNWNVVLMRHIPEKNRLVANTRFRGLSEMEAKLRAESINAALGWSEGEWFARCNVEAVYADVRLNS